MKFYFFFLVILLHPLINSQSFDQPISIKVPEIIAPPSTTIKLDSFTYEKNGIGTYKITLFPPKSQ